MNNAFDMSVSANKCDPREIISVHDGSQGSGKLNGLRRRARMCVRGAAVLAGTIALLSPLVALAQNSTVPARVTERINTSALVTLHGNTHALARAQNDQGAAPPDLPMNRIMLVLKRSAEQESALQDLLTAAAGYRIAQLSPVAHSGSIWAAIRARGFRYPGGHVVACVVRISVHQGFARPHGDRVLRHSRAGSGRPAHINSQIPGGWRVALGQCQRPANSRRAWPVIAGFASLHNFPKRAASSRSTQMANLTRDSNGRPQITLRIIRMAWRLLISIRFITLTRRL